VLGVALRPQVELLDLGVRKRKRDTGEREEVSEVRAKG